MRYLWTRTPRAFLLLVRIKVKHRRQWTIPIPVCALEETLQALHDVSWIWEKLVQVWGIHREKRGKPQWMQYIAQMPVTSTLKIGSDILRELRRHGRFRLVEVEDGETKVYVDVL